VPHAAPDDWTRAARTDSSAEQDRGDRGALEGDNGLPHRLALRDALPREDRIALDMRRIISQLVAPTPSPPLPSLATSKHPRK
jgi:hypothetical protein